MAKHKLLVAAGYLLVLCTLIITLTHYYYAFSVGFFTATNFLDDPPKYHGEIKSTMGPYGGSFDGGFFLIYNKEPIKIMYDQEYTPPRYGEVLVHGKLHREGYIEAIGVHNYDYYYLFYILSLIAGIIVIVLFLKEWKMTWRVFKNA